MKIAGFLVLGFAAALGLFGDDEKRENRPRFKGVELYSWQDTKRGWIFVLLDGTNRLKTVDQVKQSKNQILGSEDLKKAIARLAIGESVYWFHRAKDFEYPPEATIKEIVDSGTKSEVTVQLPPTRD
jgi:hypothetical protein